ncbi:MAG: nuclear transport factor 2 family protein [Anaerolineales bacterium]
MFFAKTRFLCAFFIAVTMIVLTACNSTSKVSVTPTSDYLPNLRADMEKYNQCLSQMNADCIASLFAPQGQIFDTGIIRAGSPAAIRTYMHQTFSEAHIDSLNATIDTITINGNVGVVLGTYDEKTTDATGQSSEAKLQYVAEWIYQSNGQWLLNRLSTVILQQ